MALRILRKNSENKRENKTMIYERRIQHDRRISRDDDFAGDAYQNLNTKTIFWVSVGHDPNQCEECRRYEFIGNEKPSRDLQSL